MTRQEEWETQETKTAEAFPMRLMSRITGWHKLNTRDRGEYNGYTKRAVLKLIGKKKGHVYSKPEIDAMTAYYDERLANMGLSTTAGTPDWLKFDSIPLKTAPVDPLIPCGSIECRPDKW